ncbi:MAG: hypothetical protein AAFQ88_07485 [Pseudomonadota bacterium]
MAVSTAASISGISIEQMLLRIWSSTNDLIQIRLPDQAILNETIALSGARNLLSNTGEILKSAASTEILGQRRIAKAPKEALFFRDSCRMGHTFQGSFGFRIHVPLPDAWQEGFFAHTEEPPFERRVVDRINRSLMTFTQAVEDRNISPIVNSLSDGASSRLCEDFVKLLEGTPTGRLDFGIVRSGRSENFPVQTSHYSFSTGGNTLDLLTEAAERLSEVETPIQVSFHANVFLLQSQTRQIGEQIVAEERKIRLEAIDLDEVGSSIWATPENDDYWKAVEAHTHGRSLKVTGTLVRRRGRWHLSNISAFELD